MNTNHSPLPWYIGCGGHPEKIQIVVCESNIHDEPTGLVAEVNKRIQFEPGTGKSEVAESNAAYIVQACNAFPVLVEALDDVIRDFTVIECARCDGTGKRLAHPDESCHVCAGAGEIVPQQAWPQFIKQARAALALARGEKGESK